MSITVIFNNKQDTVKFEKAHLIWKVSLKSFLGGLVKCKSYSKIKTFFFRVVNIPYYCFWTHRNSKLDNTNITAMEKLFWFYGWNSSFICREICIKETFICLVYKKVSRKFPDLIEAIVYKVYKIARGRGGGGNQNK